MTPKRLAEIRERRKLALELFARADFSIEDCADACAIAAAYRDVDALLDYIADILERRDVGRKSLASSRVS
jgi:hypothetical protein